MQDAIALAGRALELSRDHKERANEDWAVRLLGEISSHQEPPDVETAEASYCQALASAENLGMRPLIAHCHLGLGRLYRRTDKRQRGRENLTTARAMFRDMEMRCWLEKAEAELKDLG